MRFPDTRLINSVEYREKLALEIRRLRPRVVIVPYWEARHPDHFHAGAIAFDASFLAGLRKLDPDTAPHRPYKVIYSSMYANVTPSFVVDISSQFEKRMEVVVCIPVAVRRHWRAGRNLSAVSRRSRDSRASGGYRPVLRQPHRRKVRRAIRYKGNDAGRRCRLPSSKNFLSTK